MRACNTHLGGIPVNKIEWRNRVMSMMLCLGTVFAASLLPHPTMASGLQIDGSFDVAMVEDKFDAVADGGGGGGGGGGAVADGGGGGGGAAVCPPVVLPGIINTIDSIPAKLDALVANPGQIGPTESLLNAVRSFNSQASPASSSMQALQDALEAEFAYLSTLKKITIQEAFCAPAGEMVTTYPREGCILSGTPITLADGTTKPVEKLTLNDMVKGNEGAAKIIALNKFTQRQDHMYGINGGEVFFTVEHPILTPKGWKSIDSTITSVKSGIKIIGTLKVGDTVLMDGGKEIVVKSIDKKVIEDGVDAYNVSTERDGSFIANGFIMKGFKKVQMHY